MSCRRGRRCPCPRAASARAASLRAVHVRELELDLDAFEGPFDLLLTLVLREELEPRDVDVADVVVTFVEHLALGTGEAGAASPGDGGFAAVASSAERERLDLDACGEFLVLIGALLELKARRALPRGARRARRSRSRGGCRGARAAAGGVPEDQGGGRLVTRAAGAGERSLLPARTRAAGAAR